MKFKTCLLLLLFAPSVYAASPAGFVIYKAADLKAYSAKLAPKINAQKIATEKLDDFGNHTTMMAYREGSGQVEMHEQWLDLFVVVAGNATLVVGGKGQGMKSISPGEWRGDSIQGGTRHALAPGDVVHIPVNLPHQVLLRPGAKFTYFVVKVKAQ